MVKRLILCLTVLFLICSLSVISTDEVFAEETNLKYGFKELGFYSGFLTADLEEKGDYEVIPLMGRWGFDLRPLFKKEINAIVEFVLEPFINTVYNPDSNVELGCNYILKLGVPVTQKLYPYFEGGLGMIYITQHTREQSTQFNFTQHAGAGITYFLKENLTFNLGYRYRHLSNASIKHPNSGIDSNSIVCGISVFY